MLALPQEAQRTAGSAVGWQHPQEVYQQIGQILDVLHNMASQELSGRSLADYLPAGGTAMPTARTIRQISDLARGFNVQYTAGVPLAGLTGFLRFVRDNSDLRGSQAWMRLFLEAGLEFGDVVAADFAGFGAPGDLSDDVAREQRARDLDELAHDMEVSAIRGLGALAFTQVAAVLFWEARENLRAEAERAGRQPPPMWMSKSFAAVASRTSLAGMRESLPALSRAYLQQNAEQIRQWFVATFKQHVPGDVIRVLGDHRMLDRESEIEEGRSFLIGQWLDNVLLDHPGLVINQQEALGVGTHVQRMSLAYLPADEIPLALLELRAFRSGASSLEEVRDGHTVLQGAVREAYETARAAQGAAATRVASPGTALPVFSFISGQQVLGRHHLDVLKDVAAYLAWDASRRYAAEGAGLEVTVSSRGGAGTGEAGAALVRQVARELQRQADSQLEARGRPAFLVTVRSGGQEDARGRGGTQVRLAAGPALPQQVEASFAEDSAQLHADLAGSEPVRKMARWLAYQAWLADRARQRGDAAPAPLPQAGITGYETSRAAGDGASGGSMRWTGSVRRGLSGWLAPGTGIGMQRARAVRQVLADAVRRELVGFGVDQNLAEQLVPVASLQTIPGTGEAGSRAVAVVRPGQAAAAPVTQAPSGMDSRRLDDLVAEVNSELRRPALVAARRRATRDEVLRAYQSLAPDEQNRTTSAIAAQIAAILLTDDPARLPGGSRTETTPAQITTADNAGPSRNTSHPPHDTQNGLARGSTGAGPSTIPAEPAVATVAYFGEEPAPAAEDVGAEPPATSSPASGQALSEDLPHATADDETLSVERERPHELEARLAEVAGDHVARENDLTEAQQRFAAASLDVTRHPEDAVFQAHEAARPTPPDARSGPVPAPASGSKRPGITPSHWLPIEPVLVEHRFKMTQLLTGEDLMEEDLMERASQLVQDLSSTDTNVLSDVRHGIQQMGEQLATRIRRLVEAERTIGQAQLVIESPSDIGLAQVSASLAQTIANVLAKRVILHDPGMRITLNICPEVSG
jgi:hypothetical protein